MNLLEPILVGVGLLEQNLSNLAAGALGRGLFGGSFKAL